MRLELACRNELRREFAACMDAMYRAEVPAYADLVALVEAVNQDVVAEGGTDVGCIENPETANQAVALKDLAKPGHGAIRVGTPAELALLARLFAQFDMLPVDFYDLAPAGIPVFSTAFRPVEPDAIQCSPFRLFCSLLRPELIPDTALRAQVHELLDTREILPPGLEEALCSAEAQGGVPCSDAEDFVALTCEVFRWHDNARVDADTYADLLSSHRLVADIAAFKGPHINHLTPRTLDIDRLHERMSEAGLQRKATIEGPPARRFPILLRQTAFHALQESVNFPATDDTVENGEHTARFGEVEARGIALTPAGRALYDRCLDAASAANATSADAYPARQRQAFRDFPDELHPLISKHLAYFRFRCPEGVDLDRMRDYQLQRASERARAVADGVLLADAVRYEDFLPVSAAGIFRSNLGSPSAGDSGASMPMETSSQRQFEAFLGRPMLSSDVLYAQIERDSIEALAALTH